MRSRFSTGVKEAISYSAEEAWRTNSPAIGAAHLLLGLLRLNDTAIEEWRNSLGARLPEMTAALEKMARAAGMETPVLGPQRRLFLDPRRLLSTDPRQRPSLGPRRRLTLDIEAERVIRESIKEAAGQRDVEPRHLLSSIKKNSLKFII